MILERDGGVQFKVSLRRYLIYVLILIITGSCIEPYVYYRLRTDVVCTLYIVLLIVGTDSVVQVEENVVITGIRQVLNE